MKKLGGLHIKLLYLVKEFIVAVCEVRKLNYIILLTKIIMVMTQTQVNFSVGPQLEIRVLLLVLGCIGLGGRVSPVSHVVSMRTMLMEVLMLLRNVFVMCVAHSCRCTVNGSFARADA